MNISDMENDIESIEEDSLGWSEEKERIESKEQSIQNAIEKLRDDIEMSTIVGNHQDKITREKEKIDEQLTIYSRQIEKIEQDLNELITETEASRDVISELKAIGEDVEESLSILEERQKMIDESTVRLQDVISRLGLAEFQSVGKDIMSGIEQRTHLEDTPQNALREYMYSHNYTELDYMEYAQDPSWRILQNAAYPEYPLPSISREEAFSKLGEYMRMHNYGEEDFDIYSRDPIWQELHKNAYPNSIPVLVRANKELSSKQSKNEINSFTMPGLGNASGHTVRNAILNGSESMPVFKQNQILATNKYNYPEIVGEHSQVQDLINTNPLYSSGDSCYSQNCQRCVIAYEARRRGFDVHAKPYLFQLTDTLPYDDEDVGWPSVFINSKLEYCGAQDASDVKNNIHNLMMSWGEGARAIVSVEFRCGGGHVFVAEYQNGMVRYMDPQNARNDVKCYFDVIDTTTTSILRTDNCDFTERIRECCEGAVYD